MAKLDKEKLSWRLLQRCWLVLVFSILATAAQAQPIAYTSIAEKIYEVYATKYFKRVPEATPAGVQTILEEISATRPLPPGIAPQRFVESRFVRELVSSGFIDNLYKGR